MRLKDDCRFTFSIGLMKWTWDCDQIRKLYTATSNLAEILSDKMKKSGEALTILPVAAALGSEFSPSVLQTILDHLITSLRVSMMLWLRISWAWQLAF